MTNIDEMCIDIKQTAPFNPSIICMLSEVIVRLNHVNEAVES